MEKSKSDELVIANEALAFQNQEKEKRAAELFIANQELAYQDEEKEKRAAELIIANEELAFQNNEKEKRAAELIIANHELAFQNELKEKKAAELIIANHELAYQNELKEKKAAELIIANKELAFQNEEKEKRAAELIIANQELSFQNELKEKRAADLVIANQELAFQNEEKEKRAAELIIANKELAYQNELKEKKAADLIIANQELAFQNEEKEKRAAELIIANKELAYQNELKEKKAADLIIANQELAFQNEEKEKRAAELIIANQELAFQNEEKEKRAAELIIANKELAFQNEEKEKKAADLIIANQELAFQNEEKEKRAAQLAILSGDLKAQQEELRQTNNELKEKAEQLILTSKYKSEFLANMSHELRTPLNSLLILAQQLYENHDGNLSEKQVRYSKTIHSCGNDLVRLINDILDLSKIESGIISADIMPVNFADIIIFVDNTFSPIAETKSLSFKIEIEKGLPQGFDTDVHRLSQILKNLLSNAFKFTETGEVKLNIHRPLNANSSTPQIVFSIEDTGIGIPEKKQALIFEAFQQAEGSTSRKYGGTGLGLSISKGFAELLGGYILVESKPDTGSIFSLYLPIKYKETGEATTALLPKSTTSINVLPVLISSILPQRSHEDVVEDDRAAINYVDQVVLVIEDDIHFSRIMRELAHKAGLKVVVAISYLEIFDCILNYAPIAITLDVTMPETNGWNILKLLKGNKNARHIPVYVISGIDYKDIAYGMGAKSFAVKPLSGPMIETLFQQMIAFNNHKLKKVLAITANENDSIEFATLFNNESIATFYAASGKDAFAQLNAEHFDNVVIDYSLPEAINVLKFMHAERPGTPVIAYADKKIIKNEFQIIKGWHYGFLEKSDGFYGKLLNGVLKALHVNINMLSDEKNNLIEAAMACEDILIGKKVLIVDDDVRNLFALTAAFERCKIEVLTADSGKEAIGIVAVETGISMVLMDIMMPDMDGYETIRQIRKEEKNKYLPIIAVTAKAMVGDRRKCIEAGASDYITKPIRTDQLLSLMRVWLYNEEMV